MPPTKHMTGNIFKGHVQDTLFNMVGVMTNQGIQLLGMMTEAIHTPLIHDRHIAIEGAKYVFNNMRNFSEEIEYKRDGKIVQRAHQVLNDATAMLEDVREIGMLEAISRGMFADVKRTMTGGKGLAGVVMRADGYFNPFETLLRAELGLEAMAR